MSIITFTNYNMNETGQSLAASAIASSLAIEHNYRILLISTDFNNNTMESSFFNAFKKERTSFMGGMNRMNNDVSNGAEGLVRMFASNRASGDIIRSFARPILKDRLDLIPALKTKDIKEYRNLSTYFSQIADVANSAYDLVMIDMSSLIPLENQKKIIDLSSIIVIGLLQNLSSIYKFAELKNSSDIYKRNNILLCIDKYNQNSKYTNKNIGRMLNEKDIPITVPYNILFNDNCSEGSIIDYVLQVRTLSFREGKDGYFYDCVKDAAEKIDSKRKFVEYQQG